MLLQASRGQTVNYQYLLTCLISSLFIWALICVVWCALRWTIICNMMQHCNRVTGLIVAKKINDFELGDKYKLEVSETKKGWICFSCQIAFHIGNVRHYAAGLHASPFLKTEMPLCFYLVGCRLSKGTHYVDSLFYCVQQINKWGARWEKQIRECVLCIIEKPIH